MYDSHPDSEEGNLSPAIERLIKRINQNCSRAKESDKAVQHFTERRDDIINSLISDLRELQNRIYEDVKGSDEESLKDFNEIVDKQLDDLITSAILHMEETFKNSQLVSPTFEVINEKVKETLARVRGFKVYLTNHQRVQLDRNFHLPDAKKG